MKEIVVLSGKGGTGKTSLTAAFAQLADKCVVCDADVDGADLHLLLDPKNERCADFMGGGLAKIDHERCDGCGKCVELCKFEAISQDYIVDPISCEGCGVCVDLCPAGAIDFPTQKCGEWFVARARSGPMVHARLGIAQENSGKLVSLIRREARELAVENNCDLIITDGPPGIGCPVIASISGATMLVLVVEPTLSGCHDMDRVIDLAAHFRIPGMVLVNKYDLNPEMTAVIEARAQERNILLLGRIPFDKGFVTSMVEAKTIIDAEETNEVAGIVRDLWEKIINGPAMNMAGIQNIAAEIK